MKYSINQISKLITEDPDIILEADANDTQLFKQTITGLNYNGPSSLEDVSFRIDGIERVNDEEQGTFDVMLVKLPQMNGYFNVPVNEKIIQAVIGHTSTGGSEGSRWLESKRHAGKIIADLVAAWGGVNMYQRWMHFGCKTPRPMWTLDNTPVSEATPEQIEKLDEYCEQQNNDMSIIGNILAKYDLD
jgi:hypothetical protein